MAPESHDTDFEIFDFCPFLLDDATRRSPNVKSSTVFYRTVTVLQNKCIDKVESGPLVVLESNYGEIQILTSAPFLSDFFLFMTHRTMSHTFSDCTC